jgi:methylglutaconyl-CoA hydratase
VRLMTEYATIQASCSNGTARIALNRPEVHNAFNDDLLRELADAVRHATRDRDVRVLVLTGNGKSFCAGADLNWMRSVLDYTVDQNKQDAARLVDLLDLIEACPRPVIGRINGAAVGGGVGLIAVCDIAIASSDAKFGFSEVKLGIIPAMISPYVLRKIGRGPARELFLTGDRFDAARAMDIGLVNDVVAPDKLDEAVNARVASILTSAPGALAEAKRLIRMVPDMEDPQAREYTLTKIAELRASLEGQEGMRAFLEKRKADWTK